MLLGFDVVPKSPDVIDSSWPSWVEMIDTDNEIYIVIDGYAAVTCMCAMYACIWLLHKRIYAFAHKNARCAFKAQTSTTLFDLTNVQVFIVHLFDLHDQFNQPMLERGSTLVDGQKCSSRHLN